MREKKRKEKTTFAHNRFYFFISRLSNIIKGIYRGTWRKMTWCGWWCIMCVQTNGAYIYDMNRVRKKRWENCWRWRRSWWCFVWKNMRITISTLYAVTHMSIRLWFNIHKKRRRKKKQEEGWFCVLCAIFLVNILLWKEYLFQMLECLNQTDKTRIEYVVD